jgi:hypothetical protein
MKYKVYHSTPGPEKANFIGECPMEPGCIYLTNKSKRHYFFLYLPKRLRENAMKERQKRCKEAIKNF